MSPARIINLLSGGSKKNRTLDKCRSVGHFTYTLHRDGHSLSQASVRRTVALWQHEFQGRVLAASAHSWFSLSVPHAEINLSVVHLTIIAIAVRHQLFTASFKLFVNWNWTTTLLPQPVVSRILQLSVYGNVPCVTFVQLIVEKNVRWLL